MDAIEETVWFEKDDAYAFYRASKPMSVAHVVHRDTPTTTLCGQPRSRFMTLIARRRRPASAVCKRCQASYWRRYTEAMKDL